MPRHIFFLLRSDGHSLFMDRGPDNDCTGYSNRSSAKADMKDACDRRRASVLDHCMPRAMNIEWNKILFSPPSFPPIEVGFSVMGTQCPQSLALECHCGKLLYFYLQLSHTIRASTGRCHKFFPKRQNCLSEHGNTRKELSYGVVSCEAPAGNEECCAAVFFKAPRLGDGE